MCVGPKKDSAKRDVAAARVEFMNLLTATFQVGPPTATTPGSPNSAGNCPEFLSWELVCRVPGSYESLCFDVSKKVGESGELMKCCTKCEDQRVHFQRNGYLIGDLWNSSFLGTKKEFGGKYPYFVMRKVEEIIAEYHKSRV
jgi:hypothetical protein